MLGSVLKRLLGSASRADDRSAWLAQVTALLNAGEHAEAAAHCRARLERVPDDIDALQALAAALCAQGLSGEGLALLRKAAACAPDNPQLQLNLAQLYSATGQGPPAIESYRRAVSLKPDLQEGRLQLVSILKALERYDEAEDDCRAGLQIDPQSPHLRNALAGVLFEQGYVEEAIGELRVALGLAPDSPAVHSDLLRALNYVDGVTPDAIFREHRQWGDRHAERLQTTAQVHLNERAPERRLRVGYVSPYFRKHAVTFFIESVIQHHDGAAFEVLLYADVPRPDAYSERLKSYGAIWRSTVGLSDEALAEKVRGDAVDILVDLSGHTPGNRLLAFARRAAPVQATWNGYPNTTGMSGMNYRITDARCDPPGATEHWHTERLVRLPEIYMSWTPPRDAPDPGPLPAAASSRITFGSFNSCFKITPGTVKAWSRVLEATPGSRLIILTVVGERAARRVRDAFASDGITADRLDIRSRMSHDAFLAAHREVDIALDTFPYHGTTTTCFTLWMGVPVVALVGPAHVSRVGLTLLSAIELSELATADEAAYIATAVDLAGDLTRLAELRASLRDRMLSSPLTSGAACARALEKAYRQMWRAWCFEGTGRPLQN